MDHVKGSPFFETRCMWYIYLNLCRHQHQTTFRVKRYTYNPMLGGGFKHFLFSPLFGEDSHFD